MERRFLLASHPGYPFFAKFVLSTGRWIVGRDADCDLILEDLSVSRKHAEILVAGGRVQVKDLGSRNGTFVEGDRVAEARLSMGQIVQFGELAFRLRECDKLEPTRPAQAQPASAIESPPERQLTTIQLRVLDLVMEGVGEPEIATTLKRSRHTIHNHFRRIYQAFGVHSRQQLLSLILKRGDATSSPD